MPNHSRAGVGTSTEPWDSVDACPLGQVNQVNGGCTCKASRLCETERRAMLGAPFARCERDEFDRGSAGAETSFAF